MKGFVKHLLGLPRHAKQAIVLLLDAALCAGTVWLAFALRLDSLDFPISPALTPIALSLAIAIPVYVYHGLHRAVFRHSGFGAVMVITRATIVYGAIFALILLAFRFPNVPRSVGFIQPVMLAALVIGTRVLARYWLGGHTKSQRSMRRRVVIYGAGESGNQLAASLENSHQLRLMAFVDDDPKLQGQEINGKKVIAPESLPGFVRSKGVTELLLAMPSAGRQRRQRIIARLESLPLHVRTVPGLEDIADGAVRFSDIRELDVPDLLNRAQLDAQTDPHPTHFSDATLLVTGAGGTIGKELCRQILSAAPRNLLLLDSSEYNLYAACEELRRAAAGHAIGSTIVPFLGSVCDYGRMKEILAAWPVEWVFHAAAYKHVVLVEHNICEGVLNNAIGTLKCVQAAVETGTPNFVLISSDKAVRPTNVMGASKRLAEMILQALAREKAPSFSTESPAHTNRTRFSMVRFGNVLDSSGSVVPLFREQIADGGPVTVTHRDVTRYFMTVGEAARLVINAAAMARGGEVFLLDMGEPVRICDLAVRMIQLSGLTLRDEANPEGDIAIRFIGLRPGEKLTEELLIGDNPCRTAHPRIFSAQEEMLPWSELKPSLARIERAAENRCRRQLSALLKGVVSGFDLQSGGADWIQTRAKRAGDGQRRTTLETRRG